MLTAGWTYDQIAEIARRDRPRIIVAGYTS